jgi:hypothetical protein
MNHTPRGEEILSFYLLSAYIRHMEQDFEAVKKNLQLGEEFLVKNRLQFKLFLPHYYLEMGELLDDVGEKNKAREAWKKGYMESFQTPNEFLREKFQNHLRPEERQQDPVVLLRPPVDFDWIVDSAKMEKAYLDLHREMGARELLWSFQNLSIKYRDTETLINKTMRLFQRGYMLDGVYFLWDKGNGWEEAYSNQYMNPKMMEDFHSKVEDFRRLEKAVFIADPSSPPFDQKDEPQALFGHLHPFGVFPRNEGSPDLHPGAQYAIPPKGFGAPGTHHHQPDQPAGPPSPGKPALGEELLPAQGCHKGSTHGPQ